MKSPPREALQSTPGYELELRLLYVSCRAIHPDNPPPKQALLTQTQTRGKHTTQNKSVSFESYILFTKSVVFT